jgi:hypothetical protein
MDKIEFKFPDEKEPEAKQEAKKDDGFEFDIEVVDDTPEPDKGRKPLDEPVNEVTDDEISKYDESVQKRIKKLSHGYHDERRAKEAALREREEALKFAQQIVEENKRLKGSVHENTNALVEQAKRAAALELEEARRKYKEAYESFDADQVVAAQEALTVAKIKADRLANYKVTAPLKETPALQTPQNNVQINPEPAPAPSDPKALAWQEKNQWFGQDEEMTSFALGLHQKLVKEGVDTRSDEYYERVNSRLRQVFPENFSDATEKPEEKPKRTSSNVVAPASRNVAPKKITLTQTQVALAKKLKIPLELYARKVAEGMTQNG